MKLLSLVIISLLTMGIISPVYAYTIIPPTNAYSKVSTSNGTAKAGNYSAVLPFIGVGVIITTDSQGNIYFTVNGGGGGSGTYNKTSANNVVVNTAGNNINYINGTNNPIRIVNGGNGRVNITISDTTGGGGSGGPAPKVVINGNNRSSFISVANTTSPNLINGHLVSFPNNATGTLCLRNQTGPCGSGGASGITSINSQTGPAYNLLGSFANITIVNSTNKGQINLGSNVIISIGASQEIIKKIILDQLFLNGNENASSNRITNLGLPVNPTDAARQNTVGNQAMSPHGNPTDNQVLTYQASNNTALWATSQVPDSIVVYPYNIIIGNYTTPTSATVSSTG